MSLVIQAGAMKGAMPRVLKAAITERIEEVDLTPEQRECLVALQLAANKLIARTPAGKHVDVQLLFTDTPFGGMEMSVAVTATRARAS